MRQKSIGRLFASLTLLLLALTVSAAAGPERPPASIAQPAIEAEGKADESGLTFRWRVEERGDRIRSISVVVRKDGAILRNATTMQTSGTYFITPYSQGKFTLEIRVVSATDLQSQKTVMLQTKGNLPSPCPSRPVWQPPVSEARIKGLETYTLADLIRQSSLIVAGEVVDIQFCRASPQTIPFTFVTFAQLNVIHGNYTQPELTLAFAGGVMDGEVAEFVEMPQFNRKARYVLFLTARPRYQLTPTVGWSEGVLLSDPDGIKTYYGEPVIAIDEKEGRMVVATGMEPKPPPLDPVYGSHTVVAGGKSEPRRGPPGREVQPSPLAGPPMSEEQFAATLRSLVQGLRVPTPAEGRVLPTGTPFEIKPIKVAVPPLRPRR